MQISTEVSEALKTGKPVVALETTVYSSLGLPEGARQQALSESMEAIAAAGAVPALTALINGELKAGLTDSEALHILEVESPEKLALRDIPVALAQGWDLGVTTVSGAVHIASEAGIGILATGGIGGVHRGDDADVSSDLTALASYPVGVVCAGVKGFLDIGKTLEVLETMGVAVMGYNCDEFPAFWCRSSGFGVPARVDTAEDAARVLANLGSRGALVALPLSEEDEIPAEVMKKIIEESLKEAQNKNISGAAVTPFVLQQIKQLTESASVKANLKLLRNNCALAAEIAASL